MKTAFRVSRLLFPRKHALRVASVGLVTLSIFTGLTFQSPTHARAIAMNQIALGADVDDPSLGAGCDASTLTNYAALVGRMPAVVMWYQRWGEAFPNFSPSCMSVVTAQGAMSMVTWEPWGGAPDAAYKLSNIVRGDFDPYIRQYAIDAKTWGQPFFLRFAHEMNGTWYPWGTRAGNSNGNTAADYIAAWRHVHDIFTSVGATNVVWVWSPNVFDATGSWPSLTSIYPGDAYVDWVGLDGYNDGTNTSAGYSGWQTFTQIFGYSYDTLAALTQKPIMIAETASAADSSDPTTQNKAAWITASFFNEIPVSFPRLQLIDWFDKNSEPDWRINSSSAALSAYQAVVASPLYQGRITSSGAAPSSTLSQTSNGTTSTTIIDTGLFGSTLAPTLSPTSTATPAAPTAVATAIVTSSPTPVAPVAIATAIVTNSPTPVAPTATATAIVTNSPTTIAPLPTKKQIASLTAGPIAVNMATHIDNSSTILGTQVPATILFGAHEIGVRFQTTVAGHVVGLRYYCPAKETGTHIGHLWAVNGKLLGTVSFENETNSGWQIAYFAKPIALKAYTIYVASVNSNAAWSYGISGSPSKSPFSKIYTAVMGTAPGAFPTAYSSNRDYFRDVLFTTP